MLAKGNCTEHWREIYPMDNIDHPSDNWDLLNNLMLLNVLLIPITGHKNVY